MENECVCKTCGREIDESTSQWFAFDLQNGKEKVLFCSKECLLSWTKKKQLTMAVAIIIGLIIMIAGWEEIAEGGYYAAMLLFMPYMIRQKWNQMKNLFSEGVFGEILCLAIVVLGAMTAIYPIYVIIQEIRQYIHINNRYNEKENDYEN